MSVWSVNTHYSTKYELQRSIKLQDTSGGNSFGATVYNFPTSYDTSLESYHDRSPFKALQYVFHLIFITLIITDLIYKHNDSRSSPTLTIFILSFVICIALSGIVLIIRQKPQNSKESLTDKICIPLCKRFILLLFVFTILTILYYISPPLILYLCLLYVIFSNPIASIVEYMQLHDILNMKNMQIDYNFIGYNPVMIDNTDYNAVYHYLFAFILINYESSQIAKKAHSEATAHCLQQCDEIFFAASNHVVSHQEMNGFSIADIPFSKDMDNKWCVIQKYVTQHMIFDIAWMSLIFLFTVVIFWCNFYFAYNTTSSSPYMFCVATYLLYVLLFILLVLFRLFEIETKIQNQMGWLKTLYFADYIDINDINYVKFMYLYSDILTIAPVINAVIQSFAAYDKETQMRCTRNIIQYLYALEVGDDMQWIPSVIHKHYNHNYQESMKIQQFNSSNWMSLKIKILNVDDLRYRLMDHKIYAKVKMIKPQYVNHKTCKKYKLNYRNNEDMKRHEIHDNEQAFQEWMFCLKYSDVSYTKFVISVISECRDMDKGIETDYDDVIGLTHVHLKDVLNDNLKEGLRTNAAADLYCKNEESGMINIEFEVMEFNPMYHMHVDEDNTYGVDENHFNVELMHMDANDDTVPLIVSSAN